MPPPLPERGTRPRRTASNSTRATPRPRPAASPATAFAHAVCNEGQGSRIGNAITRADGLSAAIARAQSSQNASR